jgi:RimJ/RimL family protein N-acetyltransferase
LIFARDDGELLGSIGGAIEEHRIQFGYCLSRDAWGRGFATEAGNTFIRALSASPAIQRVQAFCDVENYRSARVLQKLGLQLEGTLRQYLVLPNLGTAPRDVFLFATTRGSDGAFANTWPTAAGNEP